MAIQSLGDMAQSVMLRRHSALLKERLHVHAEEVTTGRSADLSARVRGDFVPLGAVAQSLTRLSAYASVTSEAGLFTEATQSALNMIDKAAADLGPRLIQAADGRDAASFNIIAAQGRQKFDTTVAVLNTRIGDRSLFSGKATAAQAVADAEAILQTLETQIAGLATAAEVETAINAWFNDPAGFATTGYGGDAPLEPVAIADGETVPVGVTAMEPSIITTLRGLAMTALLDRGALAGHEDERFKLGMRSGDILLANQTERTALQARVGISEQLISEVSTRNAAEATSLEIARSRIVSVDPYEAATALEEARGQLDALYAVTARLSGLRLTDFLR